MKKSTPLPPRIAKMDAESKGKKPMAAGKKKATAGKRKGKSKGGY